MIDKELALKLIQKTSEHLGYNINIMNEKGIIIASRDESRIGDFHEVAYNVVKGNCKEGIIHQNENYPKGVKPGVNLPILYNGDIIGVVGVTGDPNEILHLAYVIKTAVETIIEYELYKNKIMRRQDKKNLFVNMILYEEKTNLAELKNLASRLGYRDNIYRIPVLFQFSKPYEPENIVLIIKKSPLHSKQNITFVTMEQDICVFKAVDNNQFELFENIRTEILEYVDLIRIRLEKSGVFTPFKVFVGSLQKSFKKYREAYNHIFWLMNHTAKSSCGVEFFFDYVYQYFYQQIPPVAFQNIFAVFEDIIDEKTKHMIVTTLIILFKNNMNITRTAKELGIHRNTIMARLERIKEVFGLDPLHNYNNSHFLFLFAQYLNSKSL